MAERSSKTEAAAVVLAGGRSSRMGRPKALLPFGGEPLIAHVVRRLKREFAEVVVVAAPGQELPQLPATVARDEVAYQGPVSGMYHGLKAATRELCFVTSCDAPFLNLALIAHLLSHLSDHDVVVPYWQERFQPLHAAYRASLAPLLKDQLDRGELRPVSFYGKVRTLKVYEDEIRRLDPEGLSLLNMNSPAEYEAALTLWDKKTCGFISVTVEFFGVARLLAKRRSIALDLPGDATLGEMLSNLAQRLPALAGRIITDGCLASGYTCNINGLDFVRSPNTRINPGDKIFILSADAGG